MVRRSFEAFTGGHIEPALAIFSADVEWHTAADAPDAQVYRGHEGIRRLISACTSVRTCAVAEFGATALPVGARVPDPGAGAPYPALSPAVEDDGSSASDARAGPEPSSATSGSLSPASRSLSTLGDSGRGALAVPWFSGPSGRGPCSPARTCSNVAPCGSAMAVIRTQGASEGGTITVPPSSTGLRGGGVGVADREDHAPMRRRVGLVVRDLADARDHVLEPLRSTRLRHLASQVGVGALEESPKPSASSMPSALLAVTVPTVAFVDSLST